MKLTWKDTVLKWDPMLTPGAYVVNVDPEWLWTPELSLYNAVGLFTQMDTSNAILYFDGTVTWSRTVDFTYLCHFELKNFPFDSQVCNAKFGSFRDSGYVTDFNFEINSALYQLNDLVSPSWQINEVTTFKTIEKQSAGITPFLNWSIKMTRYNSFYITTVIIPATFVTFLSLITLWINDLSSRMLLSLLAVLIIVALLWSLSMNLPVTNTVTWIQNFSSCCTIFVALVCIESTLSSYMLMKKGLPPCWVKYLMIFSTPYKMYAFLFGKQLKRRKEKQDHAERKRATSDLEMVGVGTNLSTINTIHSNSTLDATTAQISNNPVDANHDGGLDDDEEDGYDIPQWYHAPESAALLGTQSGRPRESIILVEGFKATWAKGARALDRISRTLFSLGFFVFMTVFYTNIPSTKEIK